MADITVSGWIAEGGVKIIQGERSKILVFDVIENTIECGGIGDDEFNTNHAWFHCSFQINVEKGRSLTIVPPGYTLRDVNEKGYVTINQIGDTWKIMPGMYNSMTTDQVVEYITEGKWVHVTGMEILTKGEDGNILRQVKVSKLSFDDFFEVKKPKLLRVPYKTAFFLETREQT